MARTCGRHSEHHYYRCLHSHNALLEASHRDNRGYDRHVISMIHINMKGIWLQLHRRLSSDLVRHSSSASKEPEALASRRLVRRLGRILIRIPSIPARLMGPATAIPPGRETREEHDELAEEQE